MKKSLLALAVLGAFAGAASAQTNVTIYGVADVGIQRTDTSATSSTWSLNSGIWSGSRIGFKGSEDLGGGLSAIFQLENGFAIDTGALGTANTLFNRQAFVGLKGGFGAVTLGRQYSPYHIALDTIDPFETGLAGDTTRLFASHLTTGYPIRVSNAIVYAAPAMGGLSASLIYGLGETAGSVSDNSQLGVGAGYANGPLNVQFAYHTTNVTAAGVDTDHSTVLLGGKFNFGVAALHAGFADNKNEFAGGSNKARNYLLGVSAPVGAGKLLASWVRNDLRSGNATDADQYALGYTHGLSKRTDLYTSFARTNVDVGADVNVFNVGMRHKF